MDNFSYAITFSLIVSAALGGPILPTNRLSLATWGSYYQQDHMGPGTYVFGYDIEDPATGNVQFKQEERHPNGTVTGNYGYVDSNGKPHVVTYISDERGYRAKVEVEGEPVQYYPSLGSAWGVPLRRSRSRTQYSSSDPDYSKNEIDVGSSIPDKLSTRPPYSSFPFYYKYSRNNNNNK